MPGLVPGIHVFGSTNKTDCRDKPGHDGSDAQPCGGTSSRTAMPASAGETAG
jgi:hypothetical protein